MSTTTLTAAVTLPNPDTRVRTVIERHFTHNPQDGWFYPASPAESLVRICVFGGQYRVERRRKATSAWLPIVTADTSEFDPMAFESWRTHWPLSVLAN